MKIAAIALPLLIAATFGAPSQAAGIDARFAQGNLVLSLSAGDYVDHRIINAKANRKHKKRVRILKPRKIARILHSRGYYNLRKMRTDGRIYTVKARGRRGNLVRVTVNARNGRIINRKVLRRMHNVQRWQYSTGYAGWNRHQYRDPFWRR